MLVNGTVGCTWMSASRSASFATPETAAAFGQIQFAGRDLVLRQHNAWAAGFHPVSELYPSLGARTRQGCRRPYPSRWVRLVGQ